MDLSKNNSLSLISPNKIIIIIIIIIIICHYLYERYLQLYA